MSGIDDIMENANFANESNHKQVLFRQLFGEKETSLNKGNRLDDDLLDAVNGGSAMGKNNPGKNTDVFSKK